MSTLLHQLENNEAILLMYLADELSGEDRAEVEAMLQRDAGLRAGLEELAGLVQGMAGGLERLEAGRLAEDEPRIRRILREMRRHQLVLAARPPAPLEDDPLRRRLPRWSYPALAAAASIIILIGLWGVGVFDLPQPTVAEKPTEDAVVAELEDSFGLWSAPGLDEADQQLRALHSQEDLSAPIL